MERKTKGDLQIYHKYMNLIIYSNDIVRKYPKTEKFVLAQEIRQTVCHGLRLLIYAIKIYPPIDKVKYLKELDINLVLLKIQIRLSYRYKYISKKNYETWNTSITEIENILSRWITSCQKR